MGGFYRPELSPCIREGRSRSSRTQYSPELPGSFTASSGGISTKRGSSLGNAPGVRRTVSRRGDSSSLSDVLSLNIQSRLNDVGLSLLHLNANVVYNLPHPTLEIPLTSELTQQSVTQGEEGGEAEEESS